MWLPRALFRSGARLERRLADEWTVRRPPDPDRQANRPIAPGERRKRRAGWQPRPPAPLRLTAGTLVALLVLSLIANGVQVPATSAGSASAFVGPDPARVAPQLPGTNLLRNPSFETLAGGCKILYDLLLFRAFSKHREEPEDRAA